MSILTYYVLILHRNKIYDKKISSLLIVTRLTMIQDLGWSPNAVVVSSELAGYNDGTELAHPRCLLVYHLCGYSNDGTSMDAQVDEKYKVRVAWSLYLQYSALIAHVQI